MLSTSQRIVFTKVNALIFNTSKVLRQMLTSTIAQHIAAYQLALEHFDSNT
jgi:hypothetical protein